MWGARSEMASELEVFPQGRLIYRPVAGRLLAAIKEETKTARRVLRAFRMPKQREAIFSLLAARTLHRCAESRLLPAARGRHRSGSLLSPCARCESTRARLSVKQIR